VVTVGVATEPGTSERPATRATYARLTRGPHHARQPALARWPAPTARQRPNFARFTRASAHHAERHHV